MLKKEDGISMLALFFVLLIIIAVIAVGIYLAHFAVRAKGLEDLKTEMLRIQAKVKVKSEEFTGKKEEDALVGEVPSEEILSILGLSENEKIKLLCQEDLDNMGLADIEADREYVVNYENDEIYLIKGYQKKDGQTYYALSDIENLKEKIVKEENVVQEEEDSQEQEENLVEENGENQEENP